MLEGFGKQSSKLTLKRAKGGEIFDRKGGKIVRSAIRRNDRHSKVCTAKGPRDRRVRLSAGTAIQFYDVQDRLGCGRPSEAIDWLIKEAKSAIDALEAKNEGRTEEGEVEEQVSGEEPNNCFSFYPPILSSSEFQNFSNEESFENRNQIHGFSSFKSSSELVFDSWQQKVLGQEEQFFSQGGTLQSSFSPTVNHSLCALNYDQMPADSPSPAAGEIFSGDGFSGFCGLLGIRGEKDKQNPCPNKPSSSSSLLHYQS